MYKRILDSVTVDVALCGKEQQSLAREILKTGSVMGCQMGSIMVTGAWGGRNV